MTKYGMHGSKKSITHKLCSKAARDHEPHEPHVYEEIQHPIKGGERRVQYQCSGWSDDSTIHIVRE